jgi:hypothetical protein
MTHEEIRNKNIALVFKAIINGSNTIKKIINTTRLATQTVWSIIDEYTKKGIIEIQKPVKDSVGRRMHIYSISKLVHCMYFEECPRSYSCIAINIEGKVVHRFDHAKIKDLTPEQDLKILYKKLKSYKHYKNYCVDIIGVCSEKINTLLPSMVLKTTQEKLVIDFLSEPDKIILFNFDGKLVTSAFGNAIYHDSCVKIDDISKVLPIDIKYSIDDIYDGIYHQYCI